MSSMIRLELRSLVEHWLLPALAIVLPWPIAYRLLRRLARYPGLYEEEWRPALAQAREHVPVADEDDWGWRYRTTRLVDHADFWLSRTRSARWLRRHVDGAAQFPLRDRAAVGVFFHWCAGLWSVRALHASGPHAAVLAGRFSTRSMGGARLGYLYGHIRLKELARAGGRALIYAPGTVKRALFDLAAGHWVIGTPDVPPTETALGVPVRLFGRDAWFTEGLLVIARRAGVPIVMFTLALDFDTGRRELRVSGPFDPHDPALLQRIADYWQGLLQEKSWGFTLWPAMPAWFTPPAG
jgi:phosphatidylinositol dimannoside acyltransferase